MKNKYLPAMPIKYNEDGSLEWTADVGSRGKKGGIAGIARKDGYLEFQFNGKKYLCHRVVFLLANGYLPKSVDHVNGIKSDNRPENLREATHHQNTMNQPIRSNCNSGRTGVFFRRNKWCAQISANGKKHHLGYFYSMIDAVAARMAAEKDLHGSFFWDE